MKKQNKTKQNKTKQNKTKQNKTKQNKTKQKTKQNKTKQNKTKQNKTKQNKKQKTKQKQNKKKKKKTRAVHGFCVRCVKQVAFGKGGIRYGLDSICKLTLNNLGLSSAMKVREELHDDGLMVFG